MRKAFTLAEVLITLGIIGVVAAVTIPTLITNYQKQVTVDKLKVAYTLLSQAIETSKQDNGDLSTWSLSLTNDELAGKYILPYLKNWTELKHYSVSRMASEPNAGYAFNWDTGNKKLYALSNGMVIYPNNDCGQYLQIAVDINGEAKPNIMGRDVFVFTISAKKNMLTPWGKHNDFTRNILLNSSNSHSCSKGGENSTHTTGHYSGEYCAALIINDGWKIAPDYPW